MRLRYAQGQFVQTLGVAADFAEDNGTKTKKDIFMAYDANFYLFALARVERDGLAV